MHGVQFHTRGVLTPDHRFLIIRGQNPKDDERKTRRGKLSTTFSKSELIDVMRELGMQDPEGTATKNDICVVIQDQMESMGRLSRKYGIVSRDGTFRISQADTDQKGDARMVRKGKFCNTWSKAQLLDLAVELEMQNVDKIATKDELCAYIKNHLDRRGRLVIE